MALPSNGGRKRSALSMTPMDFGAGSSDPVEKDPREVDPTLEGKAGDNYVKCGKCQACYPMDLAVRHNFKTRQYDARRWTRHKIGCLRMWSCLARSVL